MAGGSLAHSLKKLTGKALILIRQWKLALNRFTIEFGERVTAHL